MWLKPDQSPLAGSKRDVFIARRRVVAGGEDFFYLSAFLGCVEPVLADFGDAAVDFAGLL